MDKSAKIVQDRAVYEQMLERYSQVKDRDEAVEYARALTKLIFDYKMVGLIYEYYADNIVYKTADGRKITNKEDVTKEALSWISAFTDFSINIVETFASGDFESEFKAYQRYYCTGTNDGPSIYGAPTYKKIDESNCAGESLFVFRKLDGRWKVAIEYTIRSNFAVEKLIRENQKTPQEPQQVSMQELKQELNEEA